MSFADSLYFQSQRPRDLLIMALLYLQASLLVVAAYFTATITQSIGREVRLVQFSTASISPGGNGGTLSITVNWNGLQYVCSSKPSTVDTSYNATCGAYSSVTINSEIPYFIKLEWDGVETPLQIAMINIIDNNGSFFAIDQFCIR